MYRDPEAAERQRLIVLREEVAELEQQITGALLERVDEGTRKRLAQTRDEAAAFGESPRQVAAARRAFRAYRRRLRDVVAHAANLETELNTVPDELDLRRLIPRIRPARPYRRAVNDPPADSGIDPRAGAPVLQSQLRAIDGDATFALTEDRAPVFLADFRAADTPFHAELILAMAGSTWLARGLIVPLIFVSPFFAVGLAGSTGDYWLALATSVAGGCPELHIKPATFAGDLLAGLGLGKRITTGDLEIDGRYAIGGDPRFAKRVLTSKTCAALLELGRFDLPSLEVSEGFAHLRLRYHHAQRPLDRAIAILVAVRKAAGSLELLGR